MGKTNNSRSNVLYHKSEEKLQMHLPETALLLSLDETITLVQKLEENQLKILALKKKLRLAKELTQTSIQKYNELFNLTPLGYLILSMYGEIIEINAYGSRLLGKKLMCLVNSNLKLYITDETKPIFDIFLRNTFCSQTHETCGVTLISPDNLPIYVHLSGHITKNGEQCMVSLVDITEKKQMIADLIKAKEKAEESDRLKTTFLANMSHEIRTPMNGILGFADLLKEPNLSGETQNEYINILEKSGVRMLNTINDIIDISKIESGQMMASISETNITELIEQIFSFFKPTVEQKGIQFFLRNSLPVNEAKIKTDHQKVYGILSNLLRNAIKFTKEGFIEIGYNLCKTDPHPELIFYVKDTGIGIPQENMNIIFERFRQGSESNSRNYEGAGLGLCISKAFVEMLEGEIWVESEEGKGSTFYFKVPIF